MKPFSGSGAGKQLMVVAVATLALAACSSNPNKERPKNPFKSGGSIDSGAKPQLNERDLRLEAGALYALARSSLESGDFTDANLRYDALMQRYPFTDYATQAELERIYALSKEFKPDEALSAADRFLREHPRYVRADYAQYLKGVINSERDQGLLENLPFIDGSKGDTSNMRRGFDEFALLVQKYPASAYNADARVRMAHLRNRMAEHDLHVVRYYMKRGAHLAAAKRAEQVLALYPGAPSTVEALNALRISYQQLGLTQQEQDANTLYLLETNRPAPAAQSSLNLPGMSTSLASMAPASTPAAAPAPAKGGVGGFFSKVAGLFSFADRQEPVEVILPSTSSTPASTATEADKPAGEKKGNKLIVEIGDGGADPAPAKK